MLTSLLAYDAVGNVVATLDHMVARDAGGNVLGLIEFEVHEAAGGRMREIWDVEGAAGSGTWPEWLGAQAHAFRAERGSDGRITALVHRTSGFRRTRAAIDAAIAARISAAQAAASDGPVTVDIRDLVGGPDRPLALDDTGRTRTLTPVAPPSLPVMRRLPEQG